MSLVSPVESHRVKSSGDVEVATYLEIAEEKKGLHPVLADESRSAIESECIVVLDFGSQYSMLIARRIRECNVFCELLPWDSSTERLQALNPKGFVLSGGPASVYEEGAPTVNPYVFATKRPILGICYGMQLLTHQLGGVVAPGNAREYGHSVLQKTDVGTPLFDGLPQQSPVWMSHGDRIEQLPPGFQSLGYTENSPIAAMGDGDGIFGLQFHPEVVHTPQGMDILKNFLFKVCGCSGSWTPSNFIAEGIERIRRQVGDGKVICALSGGVDSAVVAALIHKAIGDQLTCIFVNNGLLRKNEAESTIETFNRNLGWDLVYVDASDRFLSRLEGVTDPEVKRKAVGEEFIRVFEEEADKLGKVDFLAQGTLYPDVIESAGSGSKSAAVIKTHHNVGGLPSDMILSLVEPVRHLFKDEVRRVGLALGLPEEMIWRQPFPGPGLSIRIIGDVTREKLHTLREADWILLEEVRAAGLYNEIAQCFCVLTSDRTVGVMGDYRTYGHAIAVRAITSEDFMTADWSRLPYDLLARISSRIVNEVPGVNRVVYDISSKPPATVEWE
ncbi:MAG: glutamine-hydrolyzing GMP synthase [Dehalococcoidia bacterium]|nr:glutamine-hydrolyzing GMP synthase [Dehalococcoidia bacterium]